MPFSCLWCLVLAALDQHWVEEPVWHGMVLEVPDQCGPSQSKVLGPSRGSEWPDGREAGFLLAVGVLATPWVPVIAP